LNIGTALAFLWVILEITRIIFFRKRTAEKQEEKPEPVIQNSASEQTPEITRLSDFTKRCFQSGFLFLLREN